MKKKGDTPSRIIKRRYEEKHKEEREAKSVTFGTSMTREEYEEIVAFLKKYSITKVDLIREGYESLKGQVEQGQKG